MIDAYILLRIKPGYEIIVKDKLKDLKEIEDAKILYGEWDMIVNVNVKDLKDLKDFVVKELRSIEGVIDTSTLVSAEE